MSIENESAFKHWINEELIERIGKSLLNVYPDFDLKKFSKVKNELGPLELKPRVQLVRTQLKAFLPSEYKKALKILLRSTQEQKLKGFDLWPYTDFIQTYGLDHFEDSLNALYTLTQLFTAEFAVRPFIIAEPERTYKWLSQHVNDENMHVRRWISEGTRPRLPWGEKIAHAVEFPQQGLELLKILREDSELYVRKSVANHLNDIAKDHPDLVVKTLMSWKKELSKTTSLKNFDWIVRHSLRTLIKNGHEGALDLIGVKKGAEIKIAKFKLNKEKFAMPDTLEFEFEIQSTSAKKQKIIIDYIIHHVRANETLSPKVFKLKVVELAPFEKIVVRKKHDIRPITTRKYYPGNHKLDLQINGEVMNSKKWTLSL